MNVLEQRSHRRVIRPLQMVCLSFLALIIVGTLLLMLPISTVSHVVTSPIDACFTATSATCVTGLVVFDTFTYWSTFGHCVILLLIQLGGLGIITFTTFFTISIKGRLGLRDMRLAGEQISLGDLSDVQRVFATIIKITFSFEALGALLLMFSFVPKFGIQGVWFAVFTSISSYCNAGFDLFGFIVPYGSLSPFVGDWIVMLVVPTLIICGGLGAFVFHDILTCRKNGFKEHSISLHTKVVFVMTVVLLVVGFIGVSMLEWNNTLAEYTTADKLGAAYFCTATPRTAGASVINYGAATELTLLLTMSLMFIGASPGSTGGGVKTSTAVVIFTTVISVIRGKSDTVIFGRRVDKSVVYKALSIALLALALVTIGTIVLLFNEPDQSFVGLAFEAISAFSTTGLSAVGSQNLGAVSRVVLIALMYIGRIGPMSFVLMMNLRHSQKEKDITIPEGKVFVG